VVDSVADGVLAVFCDVEVLVVEVTVKLTVDVQLLQHLSVTNSCTQNPFSAKYSQVNTIPFSSSNPV